LADPSVTFIVPALNEAANLEAAVAGIRAAAGRVERRQVLIFDDGSTDGTGTLADRLAAEDKDVRVVHNRRTMGLGYNYFRGIELAEGEYSVMVPGDGEIPREALEPLLARAGEADLVIPHMTGSEARPLGRRLLSRGFTGLMNLLFGLRLRYYNGPCLLRTELVRKVKLRTHGFAYMAAILVTLLRAGHTHVEVAIPLKYRRHGGSKALRPGNILSVLGTVLRLRLQA
jgi:dolichol-phosphate mannosyltransferase